MHSFGSGPRPVWDVLRATRWDPPAPAADDPDRRQAYVTALEQAEQLFRAATAVGPSAQPLLVFYGLSQAGRAIAAAAAGFDSTEWQLNGHGIRSRELDGPLAEVQVATERAGDSGSFVRLSELLGSPLWGRAKVSLPELWDCLPGNGDSPLGPDGSSRRLPLLVEHRDIDEERSTVSVPVVGFPAWVIQSSQGRKALNKYLSGFPGAQGYTDFRRVSNEPDADPYFDRHLDGSGELLMHWDLPDGKPVDPAEQLRFLTARTRPYAGAQYLFPAVTGTMCGMHPLMAWWAVLHTLSMLARYQPADWARHIDVDGSRHAVPLEQLLNEAIDRVPLLVAETIDLVAQQP